MHEAQHVRLIQNADSAMAVHRRVAFGLPADLTWEFIWLAESIIDEFRCERALYEKELLVPEMAPAADEYAKVIALFDEIRDSYDHLPDLSTACRRSFAVLERFGTLLSYAAASMVVSPGVAGPWTSLTSTAGLVATLSHVPGAASVMRDERLASIALGLAWFLREVLQDMGFDYRLLLDGSRQFELLRRMD
jgi:Pyridoxamine 5'-phosphate oxidase